MTKTPSPSIPQPPRRLLITAGPTREMIDAVRFISNRSSGKLGVALAAAAAEAGHAVTLLLGPVSQAPPRRANLTTRRFESSSDLDALLGEHFPGCDALVMAAAVCDYRPTEVHPGKLARESGGALTLSLEPTPDLVKRAAARKGPGQRVIAFALEPPQRLAQRAAAKLKRKGVDAVVANPLATMDADMIEPTWITADGELAPGPMSKADFAAWLLERLAQLA